MSNGDFRAVWVFIWQKSKVFLSYTSFFLTKAGPTAPTHVHTHVHRHGPPDSARADAARTGRLDVSDCGRSAQHGCETELENTGAADAGTATTHAIRASAQGLGNADEVCILRGPFACVRVCNVTYLSKQFVGALSSFRPVLGQHDLY